MRPAWLAGAVLTLLAPSAVASQRFAVLAGNNVGGMGTPDLGYAADDARGIAATLTQLGDFPSDHVALLENRSAADLRATIARVAREVSSVRRTGEYVLLVFYYSGHADSDGLQLGSDLVSYEELRRALVESDASAKIAIVDACSSGNLTQVKSAQPIEAMSLRSTLQDTAVGMAFIASTAAGESALESATLRASYFSAHLQGALRGAADFDGDGTVSLMEAFRYAQTQTTADTSRSHESAQHPTYDVRMSGRGDVILTVLNRAEARLVLPPSTGATYTILRGHIVTGEIPGAPTPVSLALEAGAYTVERRDSRSLMVTDVEIRSGTQPLPPMHEVAFLAYRDKGVRLATRLEAGIVASSGIIDGTFGMPLGELAVDVPLRPVRLQLGAEAGGMSTVSRGLPFTLMTLGIDAAVLVPLLHARWGELEAGGEAGFAWDTQRVPLGGTFSTGDTWLGAVVRLLFPLGPLAVGPQLDGRGHLVNVVRSGTDGGAQWELKPTGEVGLFAALSL